MTISKEERAELRDFIHEVSKGSPGFPRWEYDGSNPFEHPAIVAHTVPDGAQGIGNLPSKWDTQFACAAVNAAPKLLDALDASDERIASLEAEVAATDRLFASETAKVVREYFGKEAELKARIAELEAAAQWRPIASITVQFQKMGLKDEPSPETGDEGWCWWAMGSMGEAPTYEAACAAAVAELERMIEKGGV
jgi:hypothetical protein